MKPKSNTLFHFTRSIENLKSILSGGFHPRYCLEDVRYLMDYCEHIGYPMVCFCDIPITRLADHTNFYGEYGIGLSKEWGLKNGLEPVIYSTSSGIATKVFKYIDQLHDSDGFNKIPDESQRNILEIWNDLLPRVKPLEGNMVVSGNFVEKDFYQESEWRYVPEIFEMAFEDKEKFEGKRNGYNESVLSYTLEFVPSDVAYIFVKKESEIPAIFDFIQNNMGQFPLNDIKILTSRIISLDALSKDM